MLSAAAIGWGIFEGDWGAAAAAVEEEEFDPTYAR